MKKFLLSLALVALSSVNLCAWGLAPPSTASLGANSGTVSASVTGLADPLNFNRPTVIDLWVMDPAGTWHYINTATAMTGATATVSGSYTFNNGPGAYVWQANYGVGMSGNPPPSGSTASGPTTTTVGSPITRLVNISAPASVYAGQAFSVPTSASTSATDGEQIGYYYVEYSTDGGATYTPFCYDFNTGGSATRTPNVTAGATGTTVVIRVNIAYRWGAAGDVDHNGTPIDWTGTWANWAVPPALYSYISVVAPPNSPPTAAMSIKGVSSGAVAGVLGETLSISISGADVDSNLRAVNLWVNTPATGYWRNIRSDSTLNAGFVENTTTDNAISSGGADVASLGAATCTFTLAANEGVGTYQFVTRSIDSSSTASASQSVWVTVTDATAPTAPTGLYATNITATGFTLNWAASSDNVGVTGYQVQENGLSVAGSPTTATSLAIGGLAQGTLYNMVVTAVDAANNQATSTVLAVWTTDTQAPTVPAGLTPSAITSTGFTLSWSGSTDNVGVSGYRIYNNGVEVAGSPTASTSLGLTGLTQGTNYAMTVTAYDATGNLSPASAISYVQTTDTQAPTVPAGLTPSAITSTGFTLSWSGSTDNIGVSGYHIYNNGVEAAGSPTASTSLGLTGLTQGTNYAMTVTAYDATGNLSAASAITNVRTTDTQAPTAPTTLTPSAITATSFTLGWSGATDNVGVTGYHIYKAGVEVTGSPTASTSLALTGLTQGTSYAMTVKAFDAAGNLSAASAITNVRTTDTQAPTAPTTLTPSAITATSFTLGWSGATDNVSVTGYHIYKAGVEVTGSPTASTSLALTGLTQGTSYAMTVKAFDAAGNLSAASAITNVRTTDTQAPAVPTGLTSSAITLSGFTLSWTASTDNVAVTGYHIYKAGVEVTGSPTASTSLALSGLTPNTTYAMTVKAFDAAGNLSAASTALNVTTLADTAAPSVPAGLASSAITINSFTLSWTASTDNFAVAGYHIYKAGVEVTGSPTTATSLAITGLSPNTAYAMTVKAYDAASNLSAASSALNVTTSADTVAPTAPTGVVSSAVAAAGFTLTWTASTDNVGVVGYHIYKAGVEVTGSPTASTSFAVSGLTPSTAYAMTVKAYDGAGNLSATSTTLNVTTTADTTAPSVPTGLASSAVTFTSFTLSWSASTDNVAVAGYHIYKAGVEVTGSPTASLSLSITGLTSHTAYAMTVKAYDAAGNISAASTALNVTTATDSTAPSVPTGLAATAIQNTSFTLGWTASTDNVGVTGYHIYRTGVEVTGSPTAALSLAITGLAPNTAYAMTVKAYDAAGNISAASTTLNVTTTNNATADSDGDGIPDVIEAQLGSNPNSAGQSDSTNSNTQLVISKPQ